MKSAFHLTIYVCLIVTHFLHFLEEFLWEASFIGMWYSLQLYLFLEFVFFLFPLCLLYFVYSKKRWAFALTYVYSCIMIADGVYHISVFAMTQRYVGGGAGAVTSVGLIVLSLLLIHSLIIREK